MVATITVTTIAVNSCTGRLVTYQRNYDIFDKRNWINHQVSKECNGLVINNFLGFTTFGKLEVKQLVLKEYAQILFEDDTEIILDPDSENKINCVATNGTEMNLHKWHNPDNWLLQGRLNGNEAIPHMERLPCEYDDVVFPKGTLSGGVKIYGSITVKSFKYGHDYWTNSDIAVAKNDEILGLFLIFMAYDIDFNIHNKACNDPSGCFCGNEAVNTYTCHYFRSHKTSNCESPITPEGFCHAICGASIIFNAKPNFKISSIDQKIKDYTADTYVSKVRDKNGEPAIQIIFTEKEFTGNSLEEAKHLYQILQNENILTVNASQFLSSSIYYNQGKNVRSAFAVIFGSLFSVCLVFGFIILLFGEHPTSARLRDRLGISSAPLTYRSIFFSRSSVSEGTGLIGEGQSMAGSIQNIPNSLETPVYSEIKRTFGTSSSNASSTEELTKENEEQNDKLEPVDPEEEMANQDFENYQLINTVAEEGELVDLSTLNN
ncbi:protein amnionless isoform X2 [Diabrotica virgifera virgifera]|uniref:Protein amnionless n=1 Tax=Diabrotica virgifera virgifera TaxID=50390 RepID=A0ABM5K6B4_DIAVI|nr:protein amnionless isoform X2 [Diabrotica virgifera virgifera]